MRILRKAGDVPKRSLWQKIKDVALMDVAVLARGGVSPGNLEQLEELLLEALGVSSVESSRELQHDDAVLARRLHDAQIARSPCIDARSFGYERLRHAQNVLAVAPRILQAVHHRAYEVHAEAAYLALGQRFGDVRGADFERVEGPALVFGLDGQLGIVTDESNRNLVLAGAFVSVADHVREHLVERKRHVERRVRR